MTAAGATGTAIGPPPTTAAACWRRVGPEQLPAIGQQLLSLCAAAFAAPPWYEDDPEAQRALFAQHLTQLGIPRGRRQPRRRGRRRLRMAGSGRAARRRLPRLSGTGRRPEGRCQAAHPPRRPGRRGGDGPPRLAAPRVGASPARPAQGRPTRLAADPPGRARQPALPLRRVGRRRVLHQPSRKAACAVHERRWRWPA